MDLTLRLNNSWTILGQTVESSTMGDRDSGTPAAYAAGPATDAQLQRNGHAFNTFSEYQDIAGGFKRARVSVDFEYPQ